MFAPGVPALMKEFHSDNDELASFVVSVYVLGLAAGPLIIAPMSELYGRLPCYHVCNGLFVIFTVACALSTNLNMLIGFRLLEGIAGSAPLTIGGGSIADVIPQEKRGIAMALFALGPLLGPVIGPAGGGYLAQAKGWRWVFWLIAIIVSTCSWEGFTR
jgi:multidrug resistance protein